MKALAWDDAFDANTHQDYMSLLRQELIGMTNGRIDLAICQDPNKFLHELDSGQRFDFFITDWFDQRQRTGLQDPRGQLMVAAIRRSHPTAPIFVVSEYAGRIDEAFLASVRPVVLKSKRVFTTWLADDIIETLRSLSLLVDPHKVFLIHGHDRRADGACSAVQKFLRDGGIEPVLMASKHSRDGIMPDLLREMRSCSAFIAICTPDDYAKDGLSPSHSRWQPRQNVLFELGIVYGLARGADRLTVLQKWVDEDNESCAVLPSDWGGYVSLRFSDSINHCFESLRERLNKLGVALAVP